MRWTGYSPGPYRLSVIAHFAIASINTQSSGASYRSSSRSPGSLNSVLNDFGLKGSATLRLRSYTDLQGQLSARRFPRRVGDRQTIEGPRPPRTGGELTWLEHLSLEKMAFAALCSPFPKFWSAMW